MKSLPSLFLALLCSPAIAETPGVRVPSSLPAEQRALVSKGQETYVRACASCHGPDGQGTAAPGAALSLGAPLAGSMRVKGPIAGLLPLFINGQTGPLEGRTYQTGMMAPASALGLTRDDQLAEVISFIRYAWDNEAGPVTKDEVASARKRYAERKEPWSDSELKALVLAPGPR